MHMYTGWFWGGMWFWWLLVPLFIGALVWLSVAYAGHPHPTPRETPEQILKRRFAKGELDREQYEQMLDELRK